MENFNSTLFVSSEKAVEINIPNGIVKNIVGMIAVQAKQNKPQFVYSYYNKNITIYQISPYKKIKTITYKEDIKDYCFSDCGEFLFILNNSKLLLYHKNKLIGAVDGTFCNYRLKKCYNKIALIGDFNIILYEIDLKANKKSTIYDFSILDNDFDQFAYFNNKLSGNDILINRNIMIIANKQTAKISLYGNEKLEIHFPQPIKKIIADSLMSKVYSLCDDGKIYISNLDGDGFTEKNIISCEKKIMNFYLSFCESYLYMLCENEFLIYFTKYNNLADRFILNQNIDNIEVILNGDPSIDVNYFDIK
ncbi:hypothetical protein COBT_000839 [Conglomerata obtusa]